MSEGEREELAERVDGLLGALGRTSNGRRPADLQFSQVLAELTAWLEDDRQWRQGQPQHWKALLDDLSNRLALLSSLGEGEVQRRLDEIRAELRVLRSGFRGGEDAPDDSLRRRLVRLGESARAVALAPDLLRSAWRRIAVWATDEQERADQGIGALRDLADLHGHDSNALLKQVRDVLNDVARTIASVRDEPLPDSLTRREGLPASDRLALTELLLVRSAPRRSTVVWLEYLQAELRWPPTLELGPSVTLYRESFLRSIIHQAPQDERVPAELRDLNATGLPIWLDAYDRDEAVRGDYTIRGDPRVYLRVELAEMPDAHLLGAARETAEFLTGFASLYTHNHDIWLLSQSHHISGVLSSTHAFTFDEDKALTARRQDMTAFHLAHHADALGRHLPLRDPQLKTAARLLVWLRRADANDDPARLVLCERVIEQVSGWAGIARPARFVVELLKPMWMYQQIRRAFEGGYWNFWQANRGEHPLRDRIETEGGTLPHGTGDELPSINLRSVVENLVELAAAVPIGSDARVQLNRLVHRAADAQTLGAWLEELSTEFDRRNARLRRTRNALMHGGPIVTGTVEDVGRFAVTLAYSALGEAIEMLLDSQDLIDGFLDRQQHLLSCFEQLRSGTPPSEALFRAA